MKLGHAASLIIGMIGAIFFGTIFFGSWYTIDETDRGVLLRNGAIVGEAPIDPGLHFKLPIVEDVDTISVAYQSARFEKVESYSFDQQVADFVISVNYHVNPADVIKVRREYVSLNNLEARVLAPFLPKVLKDVFGTYKAAVAIQQRAKLNTDVLLALQDTVKGTPLTIDSIQIENIDFSDVYEKSVEEKQLAEVQVQKIENEKKQAAVTAQITVLNAQAAADATVATATADATKKKLLGEAEAYAIDQRGKALRDNPQVVSLVSAEKWDGKLPTTMPPGSTVPFIQLPAQ